MKAFASLILAGVVALAGLPGLAQDSGGGEEKKSDVFTPPEAAKNPPPESAPPPVVVVPTGYPVSEVDRPLVLPRMTLEPDAAFFINFISGAPDNIIGLLLGASMGIVDKLEAGFHMPLAMSPEFKAGELAFHGSYDLTSLVNVPNLMLAGRANLAVATSDHFRGMAPGAFGSDFSLLFEGLAKYKFANMFAMFATLGLGFTGGPGAFAFEIDLGPIVNPMEELAIELHFGIRKLAKDGFPTFMPLYIKAQYTIARDLDAFVSFGFPDLNHAGADSILLMVGAAYRISL